MNTPVALITGLAIGFPVGSTLTWLLYRVRYKQDVGELKTEIVSLKLWGTKMRNGYSAKKKECEEWHWAYLNIVKATGKETEVTTAPEIIGQAIYEPEEHHVPDNNSEYTLAEFIAKPDRRINGTHQP